MNYYEQQPQVAQTEAPRRRRKGTAIVITVIAVLVLAAAGLLIFNRLSGQPSTDVSIASVSLSDGRITLTGSFNGFAGLKDYSYTVDEDTVVVELLSALPIAGVSRDFSIELADDFSGVTEINLYDGRNSLVIWTADQPVLPVTGDNQ